MKRPHAVPRDLQSLALENAKPERQGDIEIEFANLFNCLFRKPIGVLLHFRRDRDDRNVSQQRLNVSGFERVGTNFHSPLVDLTVERKHQILSIAPVTFQPPASLFALLRLPGFVLDYDGNFRKTRRLDLADYLMDPFTLDKRIDQ